MFFPVEVDFKWFGEESEGAWRGRVRERTVRGLAGEFVEKFEEVVRVCLIGGGDDRGISSAEFGAWVVLAGGCENGFGAESSGESAEECGEGFGDVGLL